MCGERKDYALRRTRIANPPNPTASREKTEASGIALTEDNAVVVLTITLPPLVLLARVMREYDPRSSGIPQPSELL